MGSRIAKDSRAARYARAIGVFVAATLAMTALLWTAWVGVRLIFGTAWGLSGIVAFSFLLAVAICSVYWPMTRRKTRSVRSFSCVAFLAALCLAVAMAAIHFVTKTTTRFGFLARHSIALPTGPGVPGFLESTYSFPAPPERVMTDAASELASLRYRVRRENNTLSADLVLGGEDPNNKISVTIDPGRATGKHFDVDGDMVDIQKRNDWVTIQIWEPDSIPGWLRILSP